MASVNTDRERLLTVGSLQAAVRAFEAEWSSSKMNFGPDSSEALQTQVRYADVLRMAGNYEEAVEMYKEILVKMGCPIRPLTEEAADVQLSLVNIIYNKNFSEAAALVDRIDEFVTEMPTDDTTIALKKKMAETMRDLGRYESALSYFEGIYNFKSNNDPNSLDALSSHVDITTVYLEQGRYMKAMDILQGIHEEAHRMRPEHPCTLKAERYIADLCMHYGIPLMACMKYERIAEVQEFEAPRNLNTLITKHKLSLAYFKDGRYKEAIKVIESVYNIRKIETPWHPDTKRVEIDFAVMLLHGGDVSRAAFLLLSALESKLDCFDFELVVGIPRNIAMFFRKLEDTAKSRVAIRIYGYLYEKQCQMVRLGPLHPETLLTKTNVGETYLQMGEIDEALRIFEEVLDTKRELINDSINSLNVRKHLAEIYFSKKNYIRSLDHYLEVFKNERMYWGAYHDITVETEKIIDDFCLVDPESLLIKSIKDDDLQSVKNFCDESGNINIDAQDEFGCTPLHAAVAADSPKIVRYLISRGASLYVRNRSGKIPWDVAKSKEVRSIFKMVAQLFMDVKLGNRRDVAQVLSVDDGAIINVLDENGKTLLHWACRGGDLEIVKILLDKGADPRVLDKSGESALDVAARMHNVHIVDAINRYAEGPDLEDLSLRSPRRDGTNHRENL